METQYVHSKLFRTLLALAFTVAQAAMNNAAVLGACSGPLAIGGLTKSNPHTGWRNFYVCDISRFVSSYHAD